MAFTPAQAPTPQIGSTSTTTQSTTVTDTSINTGGLLNAPAKGNTIIVVIHSEDLGAAISQPLAVIDGAGNYFTWRVGGRSVSNPFQRVDIYSRKVQVGGQAGARTITIYKSRGAVFQEMAIYTTDWGYNFDFHTTSAIGGGNSVNPTTFDLTLTTPVAVPDNALLIAGINAHVPAPTGNLTSLIPAGWTAVWNENRQVSFMSENMIYKTTSGGAAIQSVTWTQNNSAGDPVSSEADLDIVSGVLGAFVQTPPTLKAYANGAIVAYNFTEKVSIPTSFSAVVAANGTNASNAVTTAVTTTGGQGHHFLMFVQGWATPNTPTDNKGNIYIPLTPTMVGALAGRVYSYRVFANTNGVGGAGHQFYAQTANGSFVTAIAMETTGLDILNPYDSNTIINTTTSANFTSAPLNPSDNNVVFAFNATFQSSAGATWTHNADGFTATANASQTNGVNGPVCEVLQQVGVSGTNYQSSISATSGTGIDSVLISLGLQRSKVRAFSNSSLECLMQESSTNPIHLYANGTMMCNNFIEVSL